MVKVIVNEGDTLEIGFMAEGLMIDGDLKVVFTAGEDDATTGSIVVEAEHADSQGRIGEIYKEDFGIRPNPPMPAADLIRTIAELSYKMFDSFTQDRIGADLAYLYAAIVTGGSVEWADGETPLQQVFREELGEDHPVWNHIEIYEEYEKYQDIASCREAGQHLVQQNDGGYCKFCGAEG